MQRIKKNTSVIVNFLSDDRRFLFAHVDACRQLMGVVVYCQTFLMLY